MENEARFCLQNLINVAYQLAVLENASKTEIYIAKLIAFFRYYFNGNGRVVLLREELHQLVNFIELCSKSALRDISLEFQLELVENGVYINSNEIITKIIGILFDVTNPIYSRYKVALSFASSGKSQANPETEKIQIRTVIRNEDVLELIIVVVKRTD
jgi:hypothetical protein